MTIWYSAEDEWRVADLDLDAYLDRIGHAQVRPSAEALRSLQEAHVRTIPFENVDVVLEVHQGLDLGVLTEKLVHRERGGYCYEHALLFGAALERLGFEVQRWMARSQPHRAGFPTHMTLGVRVGEERYLADVGFGAFMMYPMPLHDGVVVDQAGWKHRLVHDARGTVDGTPWTLSKSTEEGWEPVHAFDEKVRRRGDYEVAHHYISTHPRSPFTGQLVVLRLDHGVSRRLVGRELTVEHADGRVEKSTVVPERLGDTLRELDVVLTGTELDALRQRMS